MPQIVSEAVLVPHESLRALGTGCLAGAGLPPADARLVADSLVESNLRGIDSHGIARLPHYLNRIAHGSIQPRPQISFSQISPGLGKVNGDDGMGQLVMQRATTEVIPLARETGAAWIAVENSTHCGALAFYGLQIAGADMLGIVLTHSDSMVVPHGAKHPFCGTNPICLTVPGGLDGALCLDMATSVTPWNSITNAAIEGVPIPDHWAVDADGNPTTDPKKVNGVHAFAGHKGSGLGLMIDIFCTFLLGSPYGPDIAAMYGDPTAKRKLGGLVGAIDLTKFGSAADFHRRAAGLIERWNGQIPAMPGNPVLYPGQPELQTRARRLREGVPIGLHTLDSLRKVAQAYGLGLAGLSGF